MKIISVRKGFTSDHSSTSYEFLAVDHPLSRGARNEVALLSSRVNPTRRKVSFEYNVEDHDIPGGWLPLMFKYYDVMYSESYDWWLLAMAFNASKDQQAEIEKYEFTGDEELGTEVHLKGNRVVVAINCRLDYAALDFGQRSGWDFLDDDGDEEDGGYELDDPLLALLTKIRKQLMEGDYRALYVVWEIYGIPLFEEEDKDWAAPPVPVERASGKAVIDEFRSILAEA